MSHSALPIHGGSSMGSYVPVDITPPPRSAIPLHIDRKVEPAPPVSNPRLRQKFSMPNLSGLRIGSPKRREKQTKPTVPAPKLEGRKNRALEALDKLLEQEAFSLAALETDESNTSADLLPPFEETSNVPKSVDRRPGTHPTRTDSADRKEPMLKAGIHRLRASISVQSLRIPVEPMSPSGSNGKLTGERPLLVSQKSRQPEPGPSSHIPRSTSQEIPKISRTTLSASAEKLNRPQSVAHKRLSAGTGEQKSPQRRALKQDQLKPPTRAPPQPRLRLSSGSTETRRTEIKPPELHADRRIQERHNKLIPSEPKEQMRARVSSAKVAPPGPVNPPFHKFRGSQSMGNLAAAKVSPQAPPLPDQDRALKRPVFRRKYTPEPARGYDSVPGLKMASHLHMRTLPHSSSTQLSSMSSQKGVNRFPLDLAPPNFRDSGRSTPAAPPNNRSDSPNSRSSSVRSFSRKLFSALKSTSRSSARSSRPATPSSSNSALSRSNTELSLSDELEDWPEPATQLPPIEVQQNLARLFKVSLPLVDIDPNITTIPVDGASIVKYDMNLSDYERNEITDFTHAYYTGSPGLIKPLETEFRDKDGNYQFVERDHIAYRYRVESQLGVGSFGTVLRCRDYRTGRLVAVKVTAIRKELAGQAKVEAGLLSTLKRAGSPDQYHFVRILNSFMFRGHMCIVTELLGANLYEVLKRNNYQGLAMSSVQYITKQICCALQFLETQGIIHCDLKPENILVSDDVNCQVKIIDFGSGCHENKRVFTYIQSRFYRAPEILLGVPYTPAIDMWSLGCMVPELAIGRPLFPGEDEKDQIALLCQTLGPPEIAMLMRCSRGRHFFDPRGLPLTLRSTKGVMRRPPGSTPLSSFLPPLAADFVNHLLQWSPQRRLSASGALNHGFLSSV